MEVHRVSVRITRGGTPRRPRLDSTHAAAVKLHGESDTCFLHHLAAHPQRAPRLELSAAQAGA